MQRGQGLVWLQRVVLGGKNQAVCVLPLARQTLWMQTNESTPSLYFHFDARLIQWLIVYLNCNTCSKMLSLKRNCGYRERREGGGLEAIWIVKLLEPSPDVSERNISSSQHFLDHVTRHAVQENGQQGQQQESSDNLDGQPLVLGADQVLNGFEGSEEPQKAGVWAAGEIKKTKKQNKKTNTDVQKHTLLALWI